MQSCFCCKGFKRCIPVFSNVSMDQDGGTSDDSEEIIDGKMRVETSRGQAVFGGIFSGIFAVGFSLMPLALVIAFLAEGSDEIYFLSCIASVFGAVGIGMTVMSIRLFHSAITGRNLVTYVDAPTYSDDVADGYVSTADLLERIHG